MLIILIVRIFPAKYLAVPNILLTFANGYKTIVNYPARRPFRLWLLSRRLFYAYKVSFSRQREKGLFNMAAA
jgi:hypothetical protein